MNFVCCKTFKIFLVYLEVQFQSVKSHKMKNLLAQTFHFLKCSGCCFSHETWQVPGGYLLGIMG